MLTLAVDTNSVLIGVLIVAVVVLLVNTYVVMKIWKSANGNNQTKNESNTHTAVIPPSQNVHNEETVAAITAAITLALEEEQRQNGDNYPRANFIVKSIRRN